MTAKFQVGEAVAVSVAYPKGHCRTPFYCRGKSGVVERICGEFRNPEQLAYGRDGVPRQPLYRVRFRQAELWDGYDGAPEDAIEIEIYQHWLEPVGAA